MSEESMGSDVAEGFDSTEGESLGESSEEIITDEGGIDDSGDEIQESDEVEEMDESDSVDGESKSEPKYYKTIVNGREELVTLDQLISERQKARAASEKFQQAAALAKQAEERELLLKENPVEAMIAAGMSKQEIKQVLYEQAMALLEEDEEEAKITPEERRIRELEEENRKFREMQEQKEKERREQEEAEEIRKHEAELETEFVTALETTGVTPTPDAIQRIASLMYVAATNNYDMSAQEAAEIYQEEQMEIISNMLGGLEPEQLEKRLGKEAINKLRKYNISKIKNPVSKRQSPPKKEKSKADTLRSMEDFFNS